MKQKYYIITVVILSLIIIILISRIMFIGTTKLSLLSFSARTSVVPTAIKSSTITILPSQTITPLRSIVPIQTETSEILSNSLYLLKQENGINQIFRIDRNGSNISQITNENDNIYDYDVSRKNGDVVFVRNNSLIIYNPTIHNEVIVTDKLTTIQKIIFCGAECTLQVTNEKSSIIVNPVWSEDGNYIAYNNNGLYLYSIVDGNNKLLLPDGDNGLIYYPINYSPDGKYIMLETNKSTMNGKIIYLYEISTNHLIELKHFNQDRNSICPWDLSWTNDSKHILNSDNETAGGFIAGFWIYDLQGNWQSLIESIYNGQDQRDNRVYAPWQLKDGSYYYFFLSIEMKNINRTILRDPQNQLIPYELYHTDKDGISNRVLVRPDNIIITETTLSLWSIDGNGIILSDNFHNRLIYVPVDTNHDTI